VQEIGRPIFQGICGTSSANQGKVVALLCVVFVFFYLSSERYVELQKFGNEKVEAKIVELLERTPTAVSIDYVRYHLNISWSTTRALLLNMVIKGKVEAEKTTKSLIFRLPRREEKNE
jgi:hypothetical protein